MKILYWDLEIAHPFDNKWKEVFYTTYQCKNSSMASDMAYVCNFGYKWEGQKARVLNITDYPLYWDDPHNDKHLLEEAADIINQADYTVTHYGNKFDKKFIKGRYLKHKLEMPDLKKADDTYVLAKSNIKLASYRLDNIARHFNVKMKLKKKWPGWWIDASNGGKVGFDSLYDMGKYCMGDTVSLEGVYKHLRQFSSINVNYNRVHNTSGLCTLCGGKLSFHDLRANKCGTYKRTRCTKCGKIDRTGYIKP